MLAKPSQEDPTEIVQAFVRSNICKVAVNTYLEAQLGTAAMPTSKEYVTLFFRERVPCNHPDTVANRALPTYRGSGPANACPVVANPIPGQTPGTYSHEWYVMYENDISETYCGGLIFPSGRDNRLTVSGGSPLATVDPVKYVKYQMRFLKFNALVAAQHYGANFACDFIRKYFTETGADPELPSDACQNGGGAAGAAPYGYGKCDGIAMNATGKMGITCIQQMIDTYSASIDTGLTGTVLPALQGYFAPASNFVEKIRFQGWASMGIWYHKISQANTALAQAVTPDVKVVEPSVNKFLSGGISGVVGTLTGTGLRSKVNKVLEGYDLWWGEMPALSPSAEVRATAGPGGAKQFGSADDVEEGISAFTKGGGADSKMKSIMNVMYPSKGFWMFDLRDYDTTTGDYSGTGAVTYPLAQLAKAGTSMIKYSMVGYGITAAVSIGAAAASTKILGTGLNLIAAITGVLAGPIGALLASISGFLMMGGLVLAYVVPILPWIRVTFAVLSWIMTVFEAVIMIPVVALAHLRTDGEGLMGPMTQGAYILWLNLLLRPILTVCGFVAALLVFNSMVVYINSTLVDAVSNIAAKGGTGWADKLVYSVVYVGIIYVMANSVFKLVDIFPNATMKWIGGPQDNSFDDSAVEGMIVAGASAMQGVGSSVTQSGQGIKDRAMMRGGGGAGINPS